MLAIEQMLTTGGGWQDQIGGALSGIKLIQTESMIVPPQYALSHVKWDDGFNALFHDRLLVVYTGKARLAKIVRCLLNCLHV